jgi:prevent-host-death family protein
LDLVHALGAPAFLIFGQAGVGVSKSSHPVYKKLVFQICWWCMQKYQRRYIMVKLSNIIPVSDLRQDAAKLLKQLRNSKEPLIITQRGRATAVIIGVDAYEKSEHEKELLHLLAKGDREIETGQGYDLDTVLAEADTILAEKSS